MDSTNNQWSNLFAGNNLEAEPNFVDVDSFPSKPKYPNPIASQYKSLYDELLVKCDFENFSGDEEKAKIANRLYAQLQRITDKNSQELISIRNEAINKLGIRVSTEDKYNYLLKFCNPSLFKKPYNEDFVNKAIYFKSRIMQNADNIIELEQIETEAQAFIKSDETQRRIKCVVWKKEVQDLIKKGKISAVANSMQDFLSDEDLKKYYMRELFDLYVYRINYYVGIDLLREAFKYDPNEKDYYVNKILTKTIIDPYSLLSKLRKTIESDPDNKQYYDKIIQKVQYHISNKSTNTFLIVFFSIIGFILLCIIASIANH